MKITLEKNRGADTEKIPYFARIEIVTLTIDAGAVFEVPVYVNAVGLERKFYNVELCGFRVETEGLEALPIVIERLLNSLSNMSRLPSYVFVARRAGGVYPVYTLDGEVLATTPGGPVFRHVELAKVREYLSDYLHEVKVLGDEGLSDKLHVRGVDMRTLGLRRPVFYLKKRVPGQIDFWAPVFASGNGRSIYTYAADARREVPVTGGREVLNLRQLVAEVLITDRRLQNIYDLRPDRLFPDRWHQLKSLLTAEGQFMAGGKELQLYSDDDTFIAVETRPDEERHGLFLGHSPDDVRARVAQDFDRRGITATKRAAVPA